MRCCCCFWDS